MYDNILEIINYLNAMSDISFFRVAAKIRHLTDIRCICLSQQRSSLIVQNGDRDH